MSLNESDLIEMARQAVNATPQGHSNRAAVLNSLAIHLENRYSSTGVMADLNEAIEIGRQAVNATPQGHSNRAAVLNSLAIHLGNRYSSTGVMADLDEAIEIGRQAVNATPQGHSNRATIIGNLGTHFGKRYSKTGATADLNEAIELGRQAVNAFPRGHPSRAAMSHNLGTSLGYRYTKTNAIADLDEAIELGRQAVNAFPRGDPNRATWLNNLANHLRDRYISTGAINDFEEAVERARQAVNATPQNHPKLAGRLHNLANYLRDRHNRKGAIADLEEAVEIGRQAVSATPQDHPDRAERLNCLSNYLGDRYNSLGAITDLEEAIEIGRQAVNATPQNHPDQVGQLHNLSIHLSDRYKRTGVIADLEEAIKFGRQVIDATPRNHNQRAGRLHNLANHLRDMHNRGRAIAYLEEAIEIGRQAIDATPQNRPDRAGRLSSLANYLNNRYNSTKAITDLEKAIQIGREAVDATPQDHPNRAERLHNLASYLEDSYRATRRTVDLELSYRHFADALDQSTASTADRILAGRRLLLSDQALKDTSNVLTYAESVINLLPQLAPSSLHNADKQHLLLQAAGLASNAAAIALTMRQTPLKAVTWLEAGRGILAGGIQDLRTDVSDLQQQYPDLAATFENSRSILDSPVDQERGIPNESVNLRVQAEMDRRRQAHKEREETIREIRNQPGFDRFLLPPAKGKILEAAANGPIVIINVSRHRCDALIVLSNDVQCVDLSDDLYHEIRNYRNTMTSPTSTILQWLWDRIVDPVLVQLGMLIPPRAGAQWPRVRWIPTGPLVGFPLHAAGYHLEKQGRTTLDRVVSSYATSLRSVTATTQQPQQSDPETTAGTKITLVSMTETPEQSELQFAKDETQQVQKICETMDIQPVLPDAQKKEVLYSLQNSAIFHFAGHGGTKSNPLESLLLLKDWRKDPLTVDSLLQTNLNSKSPFLAYLSACGTGQIRDENMLDENIHLAAAYQLAGFRHVIGTLWSVDDSICVKMARMIYEVLRDEGINDRAVREGLHHASRKERDLWVESQGSGRTRLERHAKLGETGREELACWIPYVH